MARKEMLSGMKFAVVSRKLAGIAAMTLGSAPGYARNRVSIRPATAS